MTDPVTVGAFVAGALTLGGEALAKIVVGEAVKDAYKALKTKVSLWVASDVRELEKTPDFDAHQAVIADVINRLPRKEQEALRDLAQTLTGKIKEQTGGGTGGNARVLGSQSRAYGGKGGQGPAGGRGGQAEVIGNNSLAVGGDGGDGPKPQ